MTNDYEDFIAYYPVYHGLTEARAFEMAKRIRGFEQFVNCRPLSGVTARDYEAYVTTLISAEHLMPSTVRKVMGMIRPMFHWAALHERMTMLEFERIKQVKCPRRSEISRLPRPYTPDELRSRLERIGKKYPVASEAILRRYLTGASGYRRVWRHGMHLQLRAITLLALHAGLRIGEVYALDILDMHPDNQSVIVQHGKGDVNGSKRRAVPMTDTLREAIREWLKFRALLMKVEGIWDHGRPWCVLDPRALNSFTGDTVTAVSEASFRRWPGYHLDVELHRLRHTCGTFWVRAGMPVQEVSKLLGHSALKQTMGYVQIVEDDLASTVRVGQERFEQALERFTPQLERPEFETPRERRVAEVLASSRYGPRDADTGLPLGGGDGVADLGDDPAEAPEAEAHLV